MNTTILLAHAYGQSDVLELETHTLPKLAQGMARIQVKASGINPIDARRMTGEFKHTALPQTFGTEFAGVITEVEENQKVENDKSMDNFERLVKFTEMYEKKLITKEQFETQRDKLLN